METAIYCRVSTEEQAQEGFSIRAQEQKLKEYANVKDWSIFNFYMDEGISGKNITERPAINRMIEDIKAGHIKNVLVFKLDRLTRSVADLVSLIDLFKENDCAFNSLMESLDTSTASGRMFIKIIGIFAEFERENIAERVRVGKERKAREGLSNNSKNRCYGYDREDGQKIQTINEDEAQNVRRIFDMYVNQGMSLAGIAKSLNMQKVSTKYGNYWNAATIRAVITNCNYIGNVRYCMNDPARYFEAEGRHEAIVSEDLYAEAQILVEKNKRAAPTKRPSERNYFVNLIYCAECGKKMVPHNCVRPGKDGPRTIHYSFQCIKRLVKACDAKAVSAGKLEQALIDYFEKINDSFDDSIEAKQQEQVKRDTEIQVKNFRDKLRQLEGKEKEVMTFYIAGDIDFDSYRDMKKQLENDRDFVQTELDKLTAGTSADHPERLIKEDIIADFRENWTELNNSEKRLFLTNFIKRIVVSNESLTGGHFGNTVIKHVEFNTY